VKVEPNMSMEPRGRILRRENLSTRKGPGEGGGGGPRATENYNQYRPIIHASNNRPMYYNYGLYLLATVYKRLITFYLPSIWGGRGGGSKNKKEQVNYK